jgi:hypothetical protein
MLKNQVFAYKQKLDPTGLNSASAMYSTTGKYMSISKNPCDFSAALEAQHCAGAGGRGNDVDNLYYAPIGFNQSSIQKVCEIDSGDYYINVRNSKTWNGADSCPTGQACEYYLSW